MAVLLIIFSVKATSSNSKVKMAPGGVQVPTIKWCSILLCGGDVSGVWYGKGGIPDGLYIQG